MAGRRAMVEKDSATPLLTAHTGGFLIVCVLRVMIASIARARERERSVLVYFNILDKYV